MIQSSLVPMVIDNSGGGERAFDIYSLLFITLPQHIQLMHRYGICS
jgi:hypothetical protein